MQLTTYLKTHRLKLHHMAERTGLSVSHLSRIARGATLPSMRAALAITAATQGAVTLDDLVASRPENEAPQ